MPAVNAELMFQAMREAKADFNQVVYWSRPVSWKNRTLTPNPDTIYLNPFYNTKDVCLTPSLCSVVMLSYAVSESLQARD
jgi:hypothetical protein